MPWAEVIIFGSSVFSFRSKSLRSSRILDKSSMSFWDALQRRMPALWCISKQGEAMIVGLLWKIVCASVIERTGRQGVVVSRVTRFRPSESRLTPMRFHDRVRAGGGTRSMAISCSQLSFRTKSTDCSTTNGVRKLNKCLELSNYCPL